MSCIEFVPNDLKRGASIVSPTSAGEEDGSRTQGILNREKRALALNSKDARLFFELSFEKLTEKPFRRMTLRIRTASVVDRFHEGVVGAEVQGRDPCLRCCLAGHDDQADILSCKLFSTR